MHKAGCEANYKIDDLSLQHSRFNLLWCKDFDIDPKIILDIGSYDGGDGIRFKKEFPNAEVYSFEGCPERQKIIEEYIDNYNVNLIKNAVTDYTGTTQWYSAACKHINKPIQEYAAQGSIYQHSKIYKACYNFISQHEKIEVPCISVNDFCTQNNITKVDVAHIDTEGAEYETVKGFHLIRPTIVYVETINHQSLWINGKSIGELHELLTKMNYKLVLDIGTDRLYKHED